jgi:hypothetical protein
MTAAVGFARSRLAALAGLLGAMGLPSCSHQADDCHFTMTCGNYDAGVSGMTGTGGVGTSSTSTQQGGVAGSTSIGGAPASGGANVGGASLGGASTGGSFTSGGIGTGGLATGGTSELATGGAGTGGFVSACSPPCAGGKPICNESAKTCVECLNNDNCPTSKPTCNPATNTCVECIGDGNCLAPKPGCDIATNTCVECTKDPHCPMNLPKCRTVEIGDAGGALNVCVECLGDSNCPTTKPGCNLDSNTCVQCTKHEHCPSAAPLCDNAKNACVECLSNADCKNPLATVCTNGTCEPCSRNADCSHITGKGVCKTSSTSDSDAGVEPDASTDGGTSDGECVQCTGTDYAACGQTAGKSLVCNSLTNTCSTTATVQSAGLCQPCVSDVQCTPGKLCYLESFGGNTVGHFCFWKQADTANGAPAACFSTANRPYVKVEKDITSIDGTTATLCTLRATSCTAYNQFSNIDCAPTGTPQDALCGFAPGADSKCAETTSGSGTYRFSVSQSPS